MTLLRYSGGRGRGLPRADSRSSNFSARGRGGRYPVVRSRSLTWTNGATPRGRNQPHQNNQFPRGTFTTIDPVPKTGVNRVWVNTSARGSPGSAKGNGGRNDTQKVDIGGIASDVPNSKGTSSNAIPESRRDSRAISARALAPSTVAESSISAKAPLPRPWSNSGSTSKAGNRIWVNNRSNLDNTPQASLGRSANLSSEPTRTPVAQPPRTIAGGSLQRKDEVLTQRNSKSGNLVWKNNDARKSAAVASPEASVPRSPPGDRTGIVKIARSVPSSGLYTSINQPVSRYSVSANRERKYDSTREEHFKRETTGHVARYSGLRGGRGTIHGGRSMVAWRGTKARGDNWATFSGRDLSAWQGGRARSSYIGGRGFQYPSTMAHMRYSSRIPLDFRFAHPASRRAARTTPWASHGAWGRWGRSAAHAYAPRGPPSTRVCSNNRSLIRVRGVILRQPMAKMASLRNASPAAAAVRQTAVARRSSFGPAGSPLTLKAKTSTNFVRSGKHGMSIWRIGSSRGATGRAAVATPAKTAEAAVSVSATEASLEGTKKPAPTAGNVPLSAPRITEPPLTSSATRSPAKTAALLRKPHGRSVVSGRASAVLAGARAKNAQVLVRNMTLYRGKGKVVMIDSTGETRGRASKKSAKKTAKAKTEPCLFFCKYGKCSKSDDVCPYAHDKTKVAVCRAFLRGECDKGDECLLTHAVQTEKMPVCIFFERGMCFTPDCPYRHVKVSQSAAVCPNFLKGYCPDGLSCRLKHVERDRKRTREADGRDDEGNYGSANGGKTEDTRGKTAAGAASAAAESAFPSKGKSGESISLGASVAGLGVGKHRNRELASSPAPGDQPRKDAGGGTVTVGTSNVENVNKTQKRTMIVEEEEDEEGDIKPRFLWKRLKIS